MDLVCADGLYEDAGFPRGKVPAPLDGRDNLDFWSADAGYARNHEGNLGDETDLFDGVAYRNYWPYNNPSSPEQIEVVNLNGSLGEITADVIVKPGRTVHAGALERNEVWRGQIEIAGDVTVEEGASLLIEPGSVLTFLEDRLQTGKDIERCELHVRGWLQASSRPEAPIVLTSRAQNPGAWYGIVVEEGGQINLSGVDILHAEEAIVGKNLYRDQELRSIRVRSTLRTGIRFEQVLGSVSLSNVEVSGSGEHGIVADNVRFLFLGGSIVSENHGNGVSATSSELRVHNCLFSDAGGTHLALGQGSLGTIRGNRFRGGIGIESAETTRVLVAEDRFVGNTTGVTSLDSDLQLTNNRFQGNGVGLRVMGNLIPTVFAFNNLIDSGTMVENMSTRLLAAEHNWWGSDDEDWIAERISGPVRWRPHLHAEPTNSIGVWLGQNYPNPFNATTQIGFSVDGSVVARGTSIKLVILSSTGAHVRRLLPRQPLSSGFHSLVWDGRDDKGRDVANGVYFASLYASGEVHTRALTLLR